MKRLILASLIAVAALCGAANAFAFSISVDVPSQYTLNDRTVDTCKTCNKAKSDDQTLTDLSGFKVIVAGMHHIGVGYENYDVKGSGKSGGGSFDFRTNLQFYDVVLDLPTHFVNFGLGAGTGQVNTSIMIPGAGTVPVAHSAGASQYFASVGIALGEHFDIHAAYHVVHTDNQKLTNVGSGSDSLNLSGHTIMAGIRLAW